MKGLAELERDHILRALEASKGVISGAAARLGMRNWPMRAWLLLFAFDAGYVHIYGPGTHRHINDAFKAGATVDEIKDSAWCSGYKRAALASLFLLKNWSAMPRASAQAHETITKFEYGPRLG